MNIKAVLGVAALAVGGSIYLGKNKYDSYRSVLENMEINLKKVTGLKISGDNVFFNVDIELVNPTDISVNVPGNKLVVKNLHFFSPKGVKLGIASPNISNISLPANGSRMITNIPVALSLKTIGSSLNEIIEVALNPDLLQTTADLEAFGKSFSVSA